LNDAESVEFAIYSWASEGKGASVKSTGASANVKTMLIVPPHIHAIGTGSSSYLGGREFGKHQIMPQFGCH
jgi:hypothetical protein